MTDKEKILLAKALKAKQMHLAKQNYIDYVKLTNPDFEPMKYSMFIIDKIDKALTERELMLAGHIPKRNQYIMLSVPPRHGKSMTVTETLPSYFMGKYPKSKTIMTAYSSTLADDFARANSAKTKDYNVFGVSIESDNQDRTVYSNKSICVKAGILGGITGKGANLLLVDDPVKTFEEANSQTYRDKVWKEWQNSLKTRLEPPAIVILIMTRWHEDDLAGRMLNKEYGAPLPWEVINLQLEAEEGDILGRATGEPLWPDRYGYTFIEEVKSYSQTFNALYQGRPTSEAGNIIKREWFQWYDKTEITNDKMIRLIMSVDATFKDTTKSDKVSIQIWGKRGTSMYLVDRVAGRMGFIATVQAIENMLKKYPQIVHKYIEDKANGSAIIDVLNRKFHGVIAVNPEGSKEARVHSILPFIEAGNVYLPRTEWADEVVEQCASFPRGANDDDVDAMSQAISKLSLIPADIPGQQSIWNFEHERPKRSEWSTGEISDSFLRG